MNTGKNSHIFLIILIFLTNTPTLGQQIIKQKSNSDFLKNLAERIHNPTSNGDSSVLIAQLCIPYKGLSETPAYLPWAMNFPKWGTSIASSTNKIDLNESNQVIFEIPISHPSIQANFSIRPYSVHYVYATPINMNTSNSWSEWRKPEFMTLRDPSESMQKTKSFSEITDKLPLDPGAPYIRYRVAVFEKDEFKIHLKSKDLYFLDSKNSTCPQPLKLPE